MVVLHPSIKDDDGQGTFYYGQDKYKILKKTHVFVPIVINQDDIKQAFTASQIHMLYPQEIVELRSDFKQDCLTLY